MQDLNQFRLNALEKRMDTIDEIRIAIARIEAKLDEREKSRDKTRELLFRIVIAVISSVITAAVTWFVKSQTQQ